MNKKINPAIFRISIKNDWNSKFIEKKLIELNTFIFQKNEISNFIFLFFTKNGLKINDFKLYYKKKLIHIFVNYSVINFLQRKNLFLFNRYCLLPKLTDNLLFFKINSLILKKYFKNRYLINIYKLLKIKFTNESVFINLTLKRIDFLKFIHMFKFKFKNIKEIYLINNFSNKLLINLQIFLNNKTNIYITVKQVVKNSNLKLLLKNNKQKLLFKILKFRKFEKMNQFFTLNLNFVYILLNLQKKSALIMEFLNLWLNNYKNFKNLNFFFKFFENILIQFLLKFNTIKGITVVLKGNLNKSSRAVKKTIKIGQSINNSKINNNIDFYQRTFFTFKGTIGGKIFIKY